MDRRLFLNTSLATIFPCSLSSSKKVTGEKRVDRFNVKKLNGFPPRDSKAKANYAVCIFHSHKKHLDSLTLSWIDYVRWNCLITKGEEAIPFDEEWDYVICRESQIELFKNETLYRQIFYIPDELMEEVSSSIDYILFNKRVFNACYYQDVGGAFQGILYIHPRWFSDRDIRIVMKPKVNQHEVSLYV